MVPLTQLTCTVNKAYKLPVCANVSENHKHTRVHVCIQRGAKHAPPTQNAGRPFGQKSTLSDFVGFLRFIQLGSQVYNGAIESVQTCTIVKACKLTACANAMENHWHTRVHVCITTWCEALSSISECWAALRAEIDTFRFGGISEIHSAWKSSLQWCL